MKDQLAAFNDFEAHRTIWTYKDMGVVGYVTVHPESEYAKIIAPVRKAKTALSAENFTDWTGISPGKAANRSLAETIAEFAATPGAEGEAYVSGLMRYALTGFAALFKGMTAADIGCVLDSFVFRNCVKNEVCLAVLRQRLTD